MTAHIGFAPLLHMMRSCSKAGHHACIPSCRRGSIASRILQGFVLKSQRAGLGGPGRHGAQVQPVQEGSLEVPLEVEEEAHAPPAKEAPKDAPALEVNDQRLNIQWTCGWAFCERFEEVLVQRSLLDLTGAADSDQHSFAGSLEVPLEVEEEAHAPPAKEAPKDAPAFEVKRLRPHLFKLCALEECDLNLTILRYCELFCFTAALPRFVSLARDEMEDEQAIGDVINKKAESEFVEPQVATAPPPPQEEASKAEAASNIFRVTLESRGDTGLVLDDLGQRGLVIAALNKGPAQDLGTLQEYDCILSVNGVDNDTNRMWDILETPGALTLAVLRPIAKTLRVKKSNEEPLGIHMNFKTLSAGIVLEDIKVEGQFAKFLASLPEASRVIPGDRMVAVNGIHMKGAEMVEALKKETDLEIIALRY
ncbi:unnamed protein product [Symbiodinium natans]|uniref:PDZ domain-containing protein n=1 Tax=Symbiodinium natans TaxID=878477 RepID=A0A812SHN5_9DINO|nr:unnamed protein product [Symbiodinium natans]